MFSHDSDGDDHDVHRADTAQTHARWRHIAASNKDTDMLHRGMCLAPYIPGSMVVAMAIDSVTFYYIVAVELNYLQSYFYDLIQSLQLYPPPTPSEQVTRI